MKTIKTYTIELLLAVAVCLQSCLNINEENFISVTTLDAVITEEGITFKGKTNKKVFDEAGFVLKIDGRDENLIEVEDSHDGMMEVTLPFVYEYEDYWGDKRQINLQGQVVKYSAFVSEDWDKEYGVQKELFVPIITCMDYVDLGLSVKWAPDNENDTNKYISDVCYWSGFSPNTVINPYNQTQMCKLVYAMAIKENGYSPNMSDVTAGWNLYIG